MADARDATTMALGLSDEPKEQQADDVEHNIEEVWDLNDLRHSSERCASALERVKFFLRVPVTPCASHGTGSATTD